jgi:hypothetical protein
MAILLVVVQIMLGFGDYLLMYLVGLAIVLIPEMWFVLA